LIRDNYLSGIFGGITFGQYREVKDIPGIEVAAPIANIGYIMPFEFLPVTINRFLSKQPLQMYGLRYEWSANSGLSRYPDSSQYVYYTTSHRFKQIGTTFPPLVEDVLVGGRTVSPCLSFAKSAPLGPLTPFQVVAGTGLACFSSKSPGLQGGALDYGPLPPGQVGQVSAVFFPVFIAAIDPAQEDRLLGFNDALVAGRGLTPTDHPTVVVGPYRNRFRVVPFLASTRTYIDETLHVTVERLRIPRPSTLYKRLGSDTGAFRFVTNLSGHALGKETIPIEPLYHRFLDSISLPIRNDRQTRVRPGFEAYWTTSQSAYRIEGTDRLEAIPTANSAEAFFHSINGLGWAPMENRDVHFRLLKNFEMQSSVFNGQQPLPTIQVVGRFDPERLPGFSPLSQLPLETYYPPRVEPADQASEQALDGRPLLPTMNIGGYIAQPPLLLTSLQGLRAFTDPDTFRGASPTAPISVIRVRVAAVTGADPLSRERIKNVAQAIHERTGLAVDITAGSSPHPLLIQLPAGRFGQPPLLVREGWVEKGVAVRFLDALDRKSLALFALILLVCGFFLANGAFASVRSRRGEIGTLLCLGWGQGKIFRTVLGEVALIGGVAGIVGTVLAGILIQLFSLKMPLARTLLVAPVAVLLAAVAGVIPAWRASRSRPMDAIRPAVSERGRAGRVHRIASMAIGNLRRVPSRTALGAAGLVIGVGSLTLLLAINRAFQGVLVGTLLGNFVSVQVRGVDLGSVLLVIALGGLSVADVLFLNLKERQAEFVTLQTVGWDDRYLRALVLGEGLAMGVLGSLAGVALGVGASAFIRGIPVSSIAFAAVLAGVAGIAVAALSSLVPLFGIERLTPPTVLAEE
jgi:hypothetical protein